MPKDKQIQSTYCERGNASRKSYPGVRRCTSKMVCHILYYGNIIPVYISIIQEHKNGEELFIYITEVFFTCIASMTMLGRWACDLRSSTPLYQLC